MDHEFGKEALEETFKFVGNIVKTELFRHGDACSAVIEFENPIKAVRAIIVHNGKSLSGRHMTVHMYNSAREKFPDEGVGMSNIQH